uniref:ARAD1C38192p n=1 Tax=Blastobotrys adeninivorans TaxID=409370 RepID=A0A060T3L2_BLAAD
METDDLSREEPLNPSATTSTSNDASTGQGVKSQFTPSKWKLIVVGANRFTYSKEYIVGYFILTLLSMATVGVSLATPKGCPHFSFYILEIIVLVALIAEVVIRMIALRRFFWKAYWNIVDGFMLIICIVTLALVFAGCSESVRRGRQTSTILLVIRNVVQILRLLVLLWYNQSNVRNRHLDIDLTDVEALGFELLPDEDPEIQGRHSFE